MALQLNQESGLHVMGVVIAPRLIQLRPKIVAAFTMSPMGRFTREQFRIDAIQLQTLRNLMGTDHHSVNEFILKSVG